MKITYRQETEGLRPISILVVIIYHSNFFYLEIIFKGGFIRVDIFL